LLIPNDTLGKRIARFRRERNLTQAKLAAIVCMEENHISCIETGRKVPRMDTVARIATGLGVTIDELCGI